MGKGVAASLRGMGCSVMVSEVDPICALQASMEGHRVRKVDTAVKKADIVSGSKRRCLFSVSVNVVGYGEKHELPPFTFPRSNVPINVWHQDNELFPHSLFPASIL